MNTSDITFSRPMAAAASLRNLAADAHKFLDKRVLLMADPEFVRTRNGMLIFETCIRLLPRICLNLTIQVNRDASLLNHCEQTLKQAISGGVVICSNAEPENFDAVLVVGHSYAGTGPAIIVNSNGWLARLSSGADLDTDCRQFNPIGAIGAACLGVSEVFKKLIAVRPERGEAIDRLQFSFFNYDSGNSNPGPQLPELIHCDFVLIGCGAIGSGVTYALSWLPLAGSIDLVDPQVYALENLGTSVLVCPDDVGIAKAVKCANLLTKRGLLAVPYVEKVEQYAVRSNKKYKVVLSALDSVAARHAVQANLWPDFAIDGAIGDFQAQAFRHIWTKNDACLQCYFKELAVDGDKIAADATGLRLDRIRDQHAVITDSDIEQASEDMKTWLVQRRNKTICSVVQEAMAQRISSQSVAFAPSVPFVACLSAVMMVAELVKLHLPDPPPFDTCFQFDSLVGPPGGLWQPQKPSVDCLCQARRANIESMRNTRA